MQNLFVIVSLLGISWFLSIHRVDSHGRVLDPPMRSSVWRIPEFVHLNPPPNYDDSAIYCGGATTQHLKNGGKCGECGDDWSLPKPRPNEGGGDWSRGIIVRNYRQGQTVDVDVELTKSHKGYFEFRLCEQNNPNVPEEQFCFDQHQLPFSDGSFKYEITGLEGHYYPQILLPPDVTCSQCVLQWTYTAGNSWGDCGNGKEAVGCGPQETFRGCSDISIQASV